MYFRFFYGLALLQTVARALLFLFLLWQGTQLPGPVLALVAVCLAAGGWIFFKGRQKSCRPRTLAAFFGVQFAAVVVNLFLMKSEPFLQVSFWEMLLAGSLFDLLLAGAAVALLLVQPRYVYIHAARSKPKGKAAPPEQEGEADKG